MAFATGKSGSDRLFRTNVNCGIVSADGRRMVIDDDRVCSIPHLQIAFLFPIQNHLFDLPPL